MKRFTLLFIFAVVLLSACGSTIDIQIISPYAPTPTKDKHCGNTKYPQCYDYTVDDIIGSFKNETVVFECSGGCDVVAIFPAGTLVDAVCKSDGWCVDPRLGGYFEKKFVEGY
jgi:hypothetical protein